MTKMTRRSSNAFQDAVQVKRKSAPVPLINSLKNKSKNNNMDITPTMLEAIDFMGNDFQQSRKRIRKKPDILDMSILAEPNFSTSKSRFVGRTTVAPVLPKQRFQKPKITKSVKRKSQSPVATPRGGAGSTGKGIRTPPTGFKATVKKKRLAKPVSIPKTREPCPKSVNTVAVTKTKQPVVNKSVNSKNLAPKSTARMSTAQNKTSVRKPSSTSMSRFNKGAIFQKRKPTPQKSTENFEKAFKTLESLPERPKIASSSTSRFGGQKPIFQQIEVQPPELPSNMRPPIIQPNKPQPAKFNTTKIQPRATQKPTFNIPKTIPEANPNTVKNKTPNSAPNSTQNSAIKNVANILKPRQPPPVSNTSSSRFSGLNNIQFSAGKQSIPSNSSSRSRFSSAFKPHISLTKINEDINEAPTTNSAGQKNTVNRVLLNNQSLNSMNNTHSSNNTNLVNRNSLLNSSNNISKPSFATSDSSSQISAFSFLHTTTTKFNIEDLPTKGGMELINRNDPSAGFRVIDGPLKDSLYLFKHAHSNVEQLKPGIISVMNGEVSATLKCVKALKKLNLGPFGPGSSIKLSEKRIKKLRKNGIEEIQFSTSSERACFKITYD